MQSDTHQQAGEKTVLVVSDSSISEPSLDLCGLMQNKGYRCSAESSIEDLPACMGGEDYLALIIDIDSVEVNNRLIRDLKRRCPGIELLCVSSTRFHPELKEAIAHHFYACLMKPVDTDELFYWLKCISENELEPRASP